MSDSNAVCRYTVYEDIIQKSKKIVAVIGACRARVVVIASNLLLAIFMQHEVRFAITTAMLAATACEATTARHR